MALDVWLLNERSANGIMRLRRFCDSYCDTDDVIESYSCSVSLFGLGSLLPTR